MIFVVLIILVAIFFIFLFLILGIIFFIQRKKKLGFTFIALTLVIPLFLYLCYFAIDLSTKPSSLSENEIVSALKRENIMLKNNFTVINSKGQSDLYYFINAFKIKLSEEDYQKLKKMKSDTLKNVKNKNNLTYDTIKIILTKDKILDYYKSQHDFNN